MDWNHFGNQLLTVGGNTLIIVVAYNLAKEYISYKRKNEKKKAGWTERVFVTLGIIGVCIAATLLFNIGKSFEGMVFNLCLAIVPALAGSVIGFEKDSKLTLEERETLRDKSKYGKYNRELNRDDRY